MKRWEAWYGTVVVKGALSNGTTRNTLVTLVMVAHTESDVKILMRANPLLKFVERDDP